MAFEGKYGRVSFSKPNSIGEDEPVIVFRARDPLLLPLLEYYRDLCIRAGTPERHLRAVADGVKGIEEWQLTHATQVPQSASYEGPATD